MKPVPPRLNSVIGSGIPAPALVELGRERGYGEWAFVEFGDENRRNPSQSAQKASKTTFSGLRIPNPVGSCQLLTGKTRLPTGSRGSLVGSVWGGSGEFPAPGQEMEELLLLELRKELELLKWNFANVAKHRAAWREVFEG